MHNRARLMVKSVLQRQSCNVDSNIGINTEESMSIGDAELNEVESFTTASNVCIAQHQTLPLLQQEKSPLLEPIFGIDGTSAANLTPICNDEPVPTTSRNIDVSDDNHSVQSVVDFSSGSSDEFIPNTDSSSSSDYPQKKKTNNKENVIIADSDDEQNKCNFWEREGIIGGKKRKTRTSTKERRIDRENRKRCRNTGKSYETLKGKKIDAKSQKPLKQCRLKCVDRISEDFRKKVFDYYWGLGIYDKRVEFMKSLIVVEDKKTAKTNPKGNRLRKFSFYYNLNLGGENFKICKDCLMKTLDETNKFIQIVCSKLVACRLNQEPKQGRGKKPSYKSISEPRLEEVKQHILSFPAYESHYCRSQTSLKYLSPDLNINKMYQLYREKVNDPVSNTIYSWVFKAQGLSFKKPSLDTCSKCDTLANQVKVSEGDEKKKYEQALKEHHERAESIYKSKADDKNISLQNNDTLVICFDLQQCLPTPYLTTGSVFYKRQLWTYNLTLRDCTNKKVYCFMWHEAIAARGANQIASCIYYYIKKYVPEHIKHLILYSDSCSGQNKNSIVMATFLAAVRNTHVETITHKFFVPGHSHMDCDVDHALIEKTKKRTQMLIHHPRDWCQLVRTCSTKNPFTVIEMSQDDFYDMASLLKGPLQLKKTDEKKKKFMITECDVFKFMKSEFPNIYFKRSGQDDFDCVDFGRKRTKTNNLDLFDNLPKLYDGPIAISSEKKKDLLSLLPLIDPNVRDFYRNLKDDKDLPDIHPDLESDSES